MSKFIKIPKYYPNWHRRSFKELEQEQIKEPDLRLRKVIGMFKQGSEFRYLQASVQSHSAGNGVRKDFLVGWLAALYI